MLDMIMILTGVALLSLFFFFRSHNYRSRLHGAAKKVWLPRDVEPRPLGETIEHRDHLKAWNGERTG
jgi:hypothetical protein